MAQDHVVSVALDDVEETGDVALHPAHAVGHAGLGRAALECEERVRAGVDDGDAVTEAGHRHREVAAAASGVEHVERLAPRGLDASVEGVLENVPDHGGTERSAGAHRVRHDR